MLYLLDVLQKTGIDTFLHSLELCSPFILSLFAFLSLLQSNLGGILEFVFSESSGFLEESVIDIGVDTLKRDLLGS